MTQIKTPDLTLTGSLLVAQFNEMVMTAIDLGITGYKEVNRFATSAKGQERTQKLHAAIQAAAHPSADPEVVEADTGVHPLDQGDQTHRAEPDETTATGNNAAAETQGDDTERLPDESEEDFMARKAKKRVTKTANKAKGGSKKVKSTNGSTIREQTEEYNRLVPAAKKAGIAWAKHHTSNFENLAKAEVAMKKLKDAMKKASA